MKEVISALEQLAVTLRETQGSLRAHPWPSRSVSLMANDLIISLGMTIHSAEALRGCLVLEEEAKAEVKEVQKEEKGGEGLGEQVPGEEVHEEHPPEAPQEPKAE